MRQRLITTDLASQKLTAIWKRNNEEARDRKANAISDLKNYKDT